MIYLLIGGAPNVGKSESIYSCTIILLSKGFKVVQGSVPSSLKDFKAILEGPDKNGEVKRVLINTASDTPAIIEDFKTFRDKSAPCDICLSSVRDDNFWPRKNFFQILEINQTEDFILEIPLAKITRRGNNFAPALSWYREKIDHLVLFSLKNPPYNL